MKLWYASVNFGLEQLAAEIIKSFGAKNIKTLDSALIFSCEHEINIKCINNLFVILASFSSGNILEAAKRLLTKRFQFPQINGKTFRVIIMDCGKLRSIPANLMNEIEKNITRKTKLIPNRANPDFEIWLNRRNNNAVYFMLRVRKHPSFEKILKKGELRPDIVEIMIHKAQVNKDSVVADLFGGWGAIAAAVADSGRYKKIYSGDINNECVQHQKKRLRKPNCFVQKWDAQKLPLEDMSVDAIITDPPWGEYETLEAPRFYNSFINEAARILKRNGSFVFLTSAKEEARAALEKNGFSFDITPLKISGKDTFLFCAKRDL